ncbi:hypothetical protein [Microbacterium oleivorans]|uniref:Uncharacterized protein n=1 Tax=Microbacterium oleivorans TaxID=273677 RepID=A0A177KBR4_9MICO|nr:hypothetical protein [Microbacterium oleivorans]OAH50275.1 hypothetical protein AYL44_07365 [Microbacterium oleivorans]
MSPKKDAVITAAPAIALPDDFQDRVFKAIAVQRPAATAYIKEIRRKKPSATPAEVMKTIESQYVATTTAASAAIGASASIPAVGVPIAIGLGVGDLIFFYETTALFALCMAELRGVPVDDPDRAKAIVLGALLGEKKKNQVTSMVLAALPAGASIAGARGAAGLVASNAAPKWGDLLSQQLPDSALVPVTIVLAREAIAKGAVMGTVKISSKAIPVIGAAAGAATSFYFGSSVVKSCRTGFSAPAEEWPGWLELVDEDGDGIPDPSKAVIAMRAASESAKEFGENVWERMVDATEMFRSVDIDGDGIPDAPRAVTAVKDAANAVGGAASGTAKAVGGAAVGSVRAVGNAASGTANAVAGLFKRDKKKQPSGEPHSDDGHDVAEADEPA